MSAPIEKRLLDRFFRYSAIPSQSNAANAGRCLPTSPGQQKLAELLASELRAAGLTDVVCDEFATVTAVKKGNVAGGPRIGFICHLDTYDAGLSPEVHPQVVAPYPGGDVCLNKDKNIVMRAAEHPELAEYVGQDIVFTDGTSVLGADDKAGVSAVMEAVTGLGRGERAGDKFGDVVVCFVPDEEIGLLGAKHLDIAARFPVDFAYTLDCCRKGDVVYECFNAASAKIRFTGVSAHPMSAKGVLVNPLLMAVDYINAFDREQTPEHTEGRQGYWWFADLHTSGTTEAVLTANIRDHDLQRYEQRKARVLEVAAELQKKYPTGRIEATVTDVYANIANAIRDDNRSAIDLLLEALRAAGVEANVAPMRGGTDGAALSAKGLLTPNFFTGAHNFHSCYEFLPVPSFVKSYEVTRNIVLLGATKPGKRSARASL